MFMMIVAQPLLFAGEWKWRAREHFETHTINKDSLEVNYKGLSNTINYWYEDSLNQAYGLAFGPVIGNADKQGDELISQLGDEVKLVSIGFEYKKWFSKDYPLFTRLGAFHQKLLSDGSVGKPNGTGTYIGLGYEYIYKDVGIAIEFAVRQSNLTEGVQVKSFTPSIGFHLYPFF